MTYFAYQDSEHAEHLALENSEIGLGYLNGATPDQVEAEIEQQGDNIYHLLVPVTYEDIRNNFINFIDKSGEGAVTWSTHITKSDLGDKYYELTFDVINIASSLEYKVGPVIISTDYFPKTISAFTSPGTKDRVRQFLYLPVEGYEDLVIVASMDMYSYPVLEWWRILRSDFAKPVFLILAFTLILGVLIFWKSTAPLRKITRVTETISQSDLSQRVDINSKDEVGRLAKSFNSMSDRLEKAFDSQKQFISDAAHELRTPLASMKTAATRALSSTVDNDECQKLIEFLNGRITNMESLVNDLLFLSSIDEGRYINTGEKLDMSDILEEAEEAFRYVFDDKEIVFTSDIKPRLYVKGERRLLLRVISNLLDNVGKHTPAGGTVSLKAYEEDGKVQIVVSDTGKGIPEDELPHIFERFYKVPDSSNMHNGFGLGLAISKSILTSCNSGISVESELGKGTIFTISIPAFNSVE
jgi:signal transduction histidine kinase